MQYDIKFSKRKSISIKINSQGIITVACPIGCSVDVAHRFVLSKKDWIDKHLTRIRSQMNTPTNQPYSAQSGDNVLFFGQELNIQYTDTNYPYFDKSYIYLPIVCDHLQVLQDFYKDKAVIYLTKRLQFLSVATNLPYQSIQIVNVKSTWGSCSFDNKIKLNYKLILLPPLIIDYVIMHELAHTLHKNHQKDFWNLVYKFCPNYKQLRQQLKSYNYITRIL